MRDLYESLDEHRLRQLVQDQERETARLEFKQLGWFGTREGREKQAHKLIARPLCAMANTHGGVIVYGIKSSSRNPDRVDRAFEVNPCASVEPFCTTVSDLAASVLEPPLLGVDAQLIELASSEFAAKVWVPESDAKPHLVGCREHEAHGHWQRSATGSFRMPQVSIEAAYRARLYREMNATPLVAPVATRSAEEVICSANQLLAEFKNSGNSPAIGLTLALEGTSPTGGRSAISCRSISVLGAGETTLPRVLFDEEQKREYRAFYEEAQNHSLVLRFRDLAGADYAVTVGLKERRNANKGMMEMSYTELVVVERNGRRLS